MTRVLFCVGVLCFCVFVELCCARCWLRSSFLWQLSYYASRDKVRNTAVSWNARVARVNTAALLARVRLIRAHRRGNIVRNTRYCCCTSRKVHAVFYPERVSYNSILCTLWGK